LIVSWDLTASQTADMIKRSLRSAYSGGHKQAIPAEHAIFE
jgi:hypothetical protein